FPEISKLGDQYQQYLIGQYETLLPGFKDILKSGGATTQEMLDAAAPLLRGEIPKDVQEQIQMSSAYQSLSAGTAGSPMSRALTARDLGLTSLNLINQGANLQGQAGNAFQRWTGIAGQTNMNPSAFLVSPTQGAEWQRQENIYQQQTKQRRYNVAAEPDPVAKGVSDTLINLLGAYLGKGMGGNQTAAQYGANQATTAPTGDYGGGIGYTPSPGQYGYGASQGNVGAS